MFVWPTIRSEPKGPKSSLLGLSQPQMTQHETWQMKHRTQIKKVIMYRRLLIPPLLAFLALAILLSIPFSLRADEEKYGSSFYAASLNQSEQAEEALTMARRYLEANKETYGLTAADLQDVMVQSIYTSPHNKVTHVYLRQRFNHLEVLQSDAAVHLLPDGRILTANSQFFTNVDVRTLATEPQLTAAEAVFATADHFGYQRPQNLTELEAFSTDNKNEFTFAPSGISKQPIPVKLVYAPAENGALELAWSTIIYGLSGGHIWHTQLSALDGRILHTEDWTITDIWEHPTPADQRDTHTQPTIGSGRLFPFSDSLVLSNTYRVIPFPYESPTDPGASFQLVSNPANTLASPYGWHDTNGVAGAEYTVTRGNNVFAYLDRNANDMPDGPAPDGGAHLVFDYGYDETQQPHIGTNDEAAIVNLFYWNNILHDLLYQYGFNETAGNFQVNNYGRGGIADDAVQARAQWGADMNIRNNATFATPPDGGQPGMRMYLWNTANPELDGDFDSGIIAHEYGHGWSNRLTGGPSNVSCLGNLEQMGEGWSDFLTVVFTAQAADTHLTPRTVGTYAKNEDPQTGSGIRPAPYTTDMNVNGYTYGDTAAGTLSIPHGIGFVWNTILWEMYWNLVGEYGFNPNLYDAWHTGGNNLALQLVHDGLALQPCSPGFVSGRDAILAADQALTGGQNQCTLWNAFAKRGLGFSASEGNTNSLTDNIEAFDLPDICKKIEVTPSLIHACVTDTADYMIIIGQILSPPLTLTSAGHPAGSSAVFASPTISSIPATTTLTISNLDSATADLYPLVITATNAFTSVHTTADLQLYTPLNTQPQLLTPAHQAADTSFFPLFSWQGTSNMQTYLLEVDDNADFTSPVYSATVTTETHQPTHALELNTTYFWRVTAANACGSVAISNVYQFTTYTTGTLACNGATVSFETGLPADWLVYNEVRNSTNISWTTTADTAHCGITNRTDASGNSGEAACIDRDILGSSPFDFDAQMVTNPFDLTQNNTAILQLQAYYRDYATDADDNFTIDVWNGDSWENLLLWSTDHLTGESLSLDLSPYAGQSDVQLRFGYTGKLWDYYAQVDEISLLCGNVTMAIDPTTITDSAVADEVLTHTVTIAHEGELFDLDWFLLQDSNQQLDDNTAEESIGHDTAFLWLNRFTPTQFPFTLEEIWVQFGSTNVSVGAAVDLLVYEDTDGDHDPSTGTALIAKYPVTIQNTTSNVWSTYPLSEPLVFETPRDILIGVVTRYNFGGLSSFPAAIDENSTHQRSWVGSFSGPPPPDPTLPTDDLWGLIDDFGFPGNWLIRGIGSSSCDISSSWLTIDSTGSTLTPGTTSEIELVMNATGLSVGEYTTDLCFISNDPIQPQLNLPVTLTVVTTHHPQWVALPTDEAFARHVYSQTISAIDEDPGDTLTITAGLPDWLSLIPLDNGRARLYGTPAEEAVGQYPIWLTATDSEGLTATEQITLTVTTLNRPPLAIADVLTITENVSATIQMLSNDSDLENDPITVVTYTQPIHGQVSLGLDNSLLYTPKADFIGTDALSYIVSDGYLTSTAAITIHVVNISPTLLLDLPATGIINVPISFSLTISDTTIAPAAVSWQLGDGTHLTDTLSFTHTYREDGNYGIIVTVTDVHGATTTAEHALVIQSSIFYVPFVTRP